MTNPKFSELTVTATRTTRGGWIWFIQDASGGTVEALEDPKQTREEALAEGEARADALRKQGSNDA